MIYSLSLLVKDTAIVTSLFAHYANAESTKKPSHHFCYNWSSQGQKKDINANTEVGLKFQTFASQTTKLKEILQFGCNRLKMEAIRADIQALWSLISYTGASTSDAALPLLSYIFLKIQKKASSILLTMLCMRKNVQCYFARQPHQFKTHTNRHTQAKSESVTAAFQLTVFLWFHTWPQISCEHNR